MLTAQSPINSIHSGFIFQLLNCLQLLFFYFAACKELTKYKVLTNYIINIL